MRYLDGGDEEDRIIYSLFFDEKAMFKKWHN